MKLDQGNCHLLYLNINMKIFWIVTKKWKSNKLLGLDRNLNFNDYVWPLCKEPGKNHSIFAKLSILLA